MKVFFSLEATREIEAYRRSLKKGEKVEDSDFYEFSRCNLLIHFHPFLDCECPDDVLVDYINLELGFCKKLSNGKFLLKEYEA